VFGDQCGINAAFIWTATLRGVVCPSTLGYSWQWYDRSAHRGRQLDEEWLVFDPLDLVRVYDGEIQPHEVVPTWFRPTFIDDADQQHDGYLGLETPWPASPGFKESGVTTTARSRGFTYDPDAGRLYVMDLQVLPSTQIVHVYDLVEN